MILHIVNDNDEWHIHMCVFRVSKIELSQYSAHDGAIICYAKLSKPHSLQITFEAFTYKQKFSHGERVRIGHLLWENNI